MTFQQSDLDLSYLDGQSLHYIQQIDSTSFHILLSEVFLLFAPCHLAFGFIYYTQYVTTDPTVIHRLRFHVHPVSWSIAY
jgi:hypothetical protein